MFSVLLKSSFSQVSLSHPPAILARYPLQAVLVQSCELDTSAHTQRLGPSLTHERPLQRWTPNSHVRFLHGSLCSHCVTTSCVQFHSAGPAPHSKILRPVTSAEQRESQLPRVSLHEQFASRLVVPRRAGNNGYQQHFPLSEIWWRLQVYFLSVSCVTQFLSFSTIFLISPVGILCGSIPSPYGSSLTVGLIKPCQMPLITIKTVHIHWAFFSRVSPRYSSSLNATSALQICPDKTRGPAGSSDEHKGTKHHILSINQSYD